MLDPLLFAFAEWLVKPPCAVASGDPGVFITMGPGAGVEPVEFAVRTEPRPARLKQLHPQHGQVGKAVGRGTGRPDDDVQIAAHCLCPPLHPPHRQLL